MKKWLLFLSISNSLSGMGLLRCMPTHNFLTLRVMLATGLLDPNKPDRHGDTMLHHAVLHEDEKYLKIVVSHSNDIDLRDRCGWAAIHYAALKGNDTFIRLLAKKGAAINAPTNPTSSITALHLAASGLHLDATRELLDAGANPLATNIHNQTPLHEACLTQGPTNSAHKLQIASLLIERAMAKGNTIDSYVLAQDRKGKAAPDYLDESEQEEFITTCNQLQFKQMLKKNKMNTTTYLRNRELGFIANHRP